LWLCTLYLCTFPAIQPLLERAEAETLSAPDKQSLPAFPEALGFGRFSFGGSGRHLKSPTSRIFTISNLLNHGPGSLRECLEFSAPRTCIFAVSGRIVLNEPLRIKHPYLTVAGQTAPKPGIWISDAGIIISTHNVIIQHLAIRIGDSPSRQKDNTRDGITINGKDDDAYNILLDHLSLSWAIDENFSTYGDKVRDITLSNSIVSEGLYRSIHPEGPHSMGMLIGDGTQRITVTGSILAFNNDRNPRVKPGSSLEFINNLVYGWGGFSGTHMLNPADTEKTNLETKLVFAGNKYIPGAWSPKSPPLNGKPISPNFRAYVKSNFGPSRIDELADEWEISGIDADFQVAAPPFATSQILVKHPEQTESDSLTLAGTRPVERDSVDRRVIEEITSRRGEIKDCVSNCVRNAGGWPTQGPGQVDLKAAKIKQIIPSSPFGDTDQNGYTNLEDWLNCEHRKLTGKTPPTASCLAGTT